MRKTALVLANILLPIAVLVFASGFFPYKPVLPGLATLKQGDGGAPEAAFDRVIFMVVDALRSDFVYGHDSGFEYTQGLIRNGAAIPFTAHATPPTVTMPRVKALTTGSVPSFLDLILNFAESDTSSSLATQDTWLAQIRAKGGKLVFYGDDTWLKLFPGDFFSRVDGTSSFFVSDFTEVDNNVTRHVPGELKRDDWDGMIMHYLGLDHIGHKTGPQGPNMLPKQMEMDGIVKMIYEAMEREPHHAKTLLVVAGDHGMNAGGNHGGSGPGETEPALLFASPKLKRMRKSREYECPTTPKAGTEFHYYTKVEQSDLIPTLAGMMGLPISRNSLGTSIPELSGLWSEEETLQHLRRNAEQILQIVEATFGEESFRTAVSTFRNLHLSTNELCEDKTEGEQRLACLWAFAESKADERPSQRQARDAQVAINKFLLTAQDSLSGTASSYNIPRMVIGMILSAAIIMLTLLSFPASWPSSTASTFFAFTSVLYGVMMFASSYVEEEQQFWYWITPAWISLLGASNVSTVRSTTARTQVALATVASLAVHRFAVRWNQTGQKHSGADDIVHTLFPNAHVTMWLLVLSAFGYNGFALVRRAFAGILEPEMSVLAAVALVVPAIVFKLNFTQADAPELVQGLAEKIREWSEPFDLVSQARFAFITLGLATLVVVVLSVNSARASTKVGMKEAGLLPSLAERLHHLLTLFLMIQTRAPNIPLFLGLEVQREALAYIIHASTTTSKGRTVVQIATSTLLFSHVYYFCAGGSNSISSIDLSNAYNGVSDYNVLAVGVLLFASNWTAPIWWCSAANLLLTSKPSSRQQADAHGGRKWIDGERTKLHEDTLRSVMGSEKTDGPEGTWFTYVSLMTAFMSTSLLAVMAACTALRTHLFIWTVFSPKYLYAMAWSIGWHLVVNIGFGSLLNWLASIN
ncbi:related to LAS21 transferase, adding a side chain to the GPI core structure [Ramularia collo-cygni]|uniref:GPI ethanolamine phosphate transferase 2 n=1 Tax=Ramularia collo-cygni TaxID=112498 RepID=A0A2D3V226_9PEZI|nr:related to LAS21 transferase, adding a side chain to the GPI core structure [Ramularia collo-cygni]CZT21858.1 related to LAS21 transferase, adding a side chain to the GPI core structure [Ramularia collo-cygni]